MPDPSTSGADDARGTATPNNTAKPNNTAAPNKPAAPNNTAKLSVADPCVGTVLRDRHVLIELVDEFGRTQWWRATDTELQRPVLVSITATATDGETDRPRSIAQRRLGFTPIIHDVQHTENGLIVVMEPVPGRSLRQTLRENGRMNLVAAEALWVPLTAAVQEAHDVGLHHGNLRPDLVWVDPNNPDQQPMVLGFEISFVAPEAAYTSPELRGADASAHRIEPTASGDVYALSAMLYEMVSGHRPAGKPDRLHHQTDIDWPLADVVMSGLAPEPQMRPDSPGALAAALVDARQETAPKRTRKSADMPQLRPDPRRWLIPVFALFSLALVGTLIGWATGLFDGGSRTVTTATAITRTTIADEVEITVGPTAAPAPTAGAEPTPEPASTATSTPAPTPAPIAIIAAVPFDPPPGSNAENNSAVPFVFDGVEGTEWTTEVYGSSNFGGLKQGVGIWVEFAPATVQSVTLRSTAPGWRAQIHLADEPAESLDGWGEPVATVSLTEQNTGQVTARFVPQQTRAALIWFTQLAAFGGGFGASLDDITFNNDPVSSPQPIETSNGGEPADVAAETPTP